MNAKRIMKNLNYIINVTYFFNLRTKNEKNLYKINKCIKQNKNTEICLVKEYVF